MYDAAGLRAEGLFQQRPGIRAGDGMHGVEAQGEAGLDERADRLEVEQREHEVGVDGHRVDHYHRQATQPGPSEARDVDVCRVRDANRAYFLSAQLGYAPGRERGCKEW